MAVTEKETLLTIQSSDLSSSHYLQGKQTAKAFIGGTSFHFLFFVAVLWFMTGNYLDSWAHNNVARLETFFTPWHGVLYSGLFAICALLSVTIFINHRRGASWMAAIPRGYELSTLFVFMMFFVGVGDATWHILFGIEQNIDGLLSPTHISGMIFAGIIILGPYRALYSRKGDLSRAEQFVLTITVTFFLALLAVLTQLTTVYTRFWPLTIPSSNEDGQLLAVVSFIFQGLLLTGITLVTLRRWRLPTGLFTFALTIVAAGMSVMRGHYLIDILCGIISGLLLDISYRALQPTLQRATQLRIFSVITACVIPFVYLLLVQITLGPVIWSIHLVIGSVAVCGIFGWLLSYVALPPALPGEA
jgi:hypothetical protein